MAEWKPKSFQPDSAWRPSTFQPDTPVKQEPPGMLETLAGLSPGGRGATPEGVLDLLPMAGGLAGSPGGPVTAGLGAGIGASVRGAGRSALGMHVPESFGGKLADVGGNALLGVVQEAIPVGGKLAARGVMRAAGKLTPESAQVALREGIKLTGAGLRKLGTRIGQAAEATKLIAQQATRQKPPIRFSQGQLGKDLMDAMIPKVQGQAIISEDELFLRDMTQKFLNDHPGPLTPTQLHTIKQTSDDIARPIHEMVQSGKAPVPMTDQLRARWHKTMADQARTLLHGHLDPVTGQRLGGIPGFAEADEVTSGLVRLKNEVWPAVRKERGGAMGKVLMRGGGGALGATIGATSGGHTPAEKATRALIGGAAGATLTSPAALSYLAAGLNSPSAEMLLRLLTRAPVPSGVPVQ